MIGKVIQISTCPLPHQQAVAIYALTDTGNIYHHTGKKWLKIESPHQQHYREQNEDVTDD